MFISVRLLFIRAAKWIDGKAIAKTRRGEKQARGHRAAAAATAEPGGMKNGTSQMRREQQPLARPMIGMRKKARTQLSLETGMSLRTRARWLHDAPRAFGVDTRQRAQKHYLSQITLLICLVDVRTASRMREINSYYSGTLNHHRRHTLVYLCVFLYDLGAHTFNGITVLDKHEVWSGSVLIQDSPPPGVLALIRSSGWDQNHIWPPDRWHNVGTEVIFWHWKSSCWHLPISPAGLFLNARSHLGSNNVIFTICHAIPPDVTIQSSIWKALREWREQIITEVVTLKKPNGPIPWVKTSGHGWLQVV